MGLFSRKPKAPKPVNVSANGAGNDSASVNSEGSNIRSSSTTGHSRIQIHNINRSSAGSVPQTPLTPMTPHPNAMSRVNLPKPPDPSLDAAGYLRSLGSVRERSKIVTDKALRNSLNHFDVDMARFPDVVSFVCGIIKVRNKSTTPPQLIDSYTLLCRVRPLLTPFGIARFRPSLFIDPAPRPVPALLRRRPGSSHQPARHIPRYRRQHGEVPPPDRPVPRQRLARRRCGHLLELQERRERSRLQEIRGSGYRKSGNVQSCMCCMIEKGMSGLCRNMGGICLGSGETALTSVSWIGAILGKPNEQVPGG